MRLKNIDRVALLGGTILMMLVAASAQATTFLDTMYGTPRAAALPRSMAMGGTGVAWVQGSQAIINNPAMLAKYKSRYGADLGMSFWHAGEDRSIPLFDSFDSLVRENIFALNRNTYADVQGGLLWRVSETTPMTLALGIYDRFDFQYNYFEEIRDPSPFADVRDLIIRTHEWNVDGRIRSASAGYGAQIWRMTNLGVSVHRYFGDMSNTRRVIAVRTPSEGTQQQELQRSLSGWGYSIGGHGAVNEHLDVAVSWEGEFTVSGNAVLTNFDTTADTTVVSGEESIRYPGTLNFGLTYRPRNILKTTFSVEAVRRYWENLTDTLVDKAVADGASPIHLRDTWDLRLGLEHIFYNKMPLRFGFRFVENYADAASDRSIYSVGIGYDVAGWQLDATGLFARQTSRQPFLFDRAVTTDGDVFDAPQSDTRVEDSVVSLIVGVSRGF